MPPLHPDVRLGLYRHGDLITRRHRDELRTHPGFRNWTFLPRGPDQFIVWHLSVPLPA